MTTGIAAASAKARRPSRPSAPQPPPPARISGRSAAASSRRVSATSAGDGDAFGTATAGPGTPSAGPDSMSSGSAMTTGPGRPESATAKARATISGMRSASSISVAHLASGPKAAR